MVFPKLFLENALAVRPCNCEAVSEPLLPKVARRYTNLSVASCELSVDICQLRVDICQLSVASCELSVDICQLSVASCELSVDICQLRVDICPVESCELIHCSVGGPQPEQG